MAFHKIMLIDDDEEDQEIFKVALAEVSEKSVCITFTDARKALKNLNELEYLS